MNKRIVFSSWKNHSYCKLSLEMEINNSKLPKRVKTCTSSQTGGQNSRLVQNSSYVTKVLRTLGCLLHQVFHGQKMSIWSQLQRVFYPINYGQKGDAVLVARALSKVQNWSRGLNTTRVQNGLNNCKKIHTFFSPVPLEITCLLLLFKTSA